MQNLIPGFIFSLITLLSFVILRNGFELHTAIYISLIISIFVYAFYIRKKKPNLKGIVNVSLGTGLFFIFFSSIGIKLFPPEHIRDFGDIVMPYINAITFSFWIIVSYIVLGFLLSRKKYN